MQLTRTLMGLATAFPALALTMEGIFLPVASLAARTAGRLSPSASGGALLRFALTQKAKVEPTPNSEATPIKSLDMRARIRE
jgi:hypothetical protein